MKTIVIIEQDYGVFNKGYYGYIDGYIYKLGTCYAIVVAVQKIDLVPISFLKVVSNTNP